MTTLHTTTVPRFLMPREGDALGPQNEAEQRLYQLVMEGMNDSAPIATSIAELTAELRTRIQRQC